MVKPVIWHRALRSALHLWTLCPPVNRQQRSEPHLVRTVYFLSTFLFLALPSHQTRLWPRIHNALPIFPAERLSPGSVSETAGSPLYLYTPRQDWVLKAAASLNQIVVAVSDPYSYPPSSLHLSLHILVLDLDNSSQELTGVSSSLPTLSNCHQDRRQLEAVRATPISYAHNLYFSTPRSHSKSVGIEPGGHIPIDESAKYINVD